MDSRVQLALTVASGHQAISCIHNNTNIQDDSVRAGLTVTALTKT